LEDISVKDNMSGIVLLHQKFRHYFRESFGKIWTLKIESFQNFATIFKISAKFLGKNSAKRA